MTCLVVKEAKRSVALAARVICKGGLVVFPTETSYGVGCDATNPFAVKKLFALKRRSVLKSLPVVVSSLKQASVFAVVSAGAKRVVNEVMPGPLTLVVPLKKKIPASSSNSVAFRISSNDFLRSLCRASAVPVVATSANLSGEKPVFDFEKAKNLFYGKVDLLVDGGKLEKTPSSTIVSLTGENPVLLRRGPVSFAEVKRALKGVVFVGKGAEAEVYACSFEGRACVRKVRVAKSYRHRELDVFLRTLRTGREAKALRVARMAGVRCPVVFLVDLKKCQLYEEFFQGRLLKDSWPFLKNPNVFLRQTAEFLAFMHKAGVVHGDFTTSNVMVVSLRPVVIDFGLASFSHSVEDKATDLLLFKKSVSKKHFGVFEKAYREKCDGAERVFARLEQVLQRGRYVVRQGI
ncbi:MAG: L-threonylcarbamoyladenylate synthase [Candidatus Micrarchaeia archaeon]